MKDFVAIDFETANEETSSVCAVGVVKVKDDKIHFTFSRMQSYIKFSKLCEK